MQKFESTLRAALNQFSLPMQDVEAFKCGYLWILLRLNVYSQFLWLCAEVVTISSGV